MYTHVHTGVVSVLSAPGQRRESLTRDHRSPIILRLPSSHRRERAQNIGLCTSHRQVWCANHRLEVAA